MADGASVGLLLKPDLRKTSLKHEHRCRPIFSCKPDARLASMNLPSEHTVLLSAQLSIDQAAGQVQAGAECIRLGPVNMKVLVLLLENAGRVVTRTEFFDRVWKQQLVSDDVLTRSISDLRTR
jgi:DNA-binding response OmpR family regulator